MGRVWWLTSSDDLWTVRAAGREEAAEQSSFMTASQFLGSIQLVDGVLRCPMYSMNYYQVLMSTLASAVTVAM